jgi:glycosyltransferase involved in cell wall biosynthesis
VSVAVERLRLLLREEGFDVAVLDHYWGSGVHVVGALHRNPIRYRRLLPRTPGRVVHYHYARPSTLLATAAVARRESRPYIATIHGHGLPRALRSPVPAVGQALRAALDVFSEVVAVSPEIAARLEPHVRCPLTVLSAFLPPTSGEIGALDREAERFLDTGATVCIVSGHRVTLRGGRDVYGFDIAVDAFRRIAVELPAARLAFFLGCSPRDPRARRHLRALQNEVFAAGLEDRFLVRIGLPLLGALRERAVLLRPTLTDGDSVSVREALSLGVPVVASDVVVRPPGVVLAAAGDASSLAVAIRRAVTGSSVRAASPPPSRERHLELYERHLSGRKTREHPQPRH